MKCWQLSQMASKLLILPWVSMVSVFFQYLPDVQLHLATHVVLANFFGTLIADTGLIEHPTISLVKWLTVPHLDANGQVISEESLCH